ncbi:MAG: hypothetical protein J6Y78_15920 [Paludibacteraceae bacterium]|nr:hypothetical protein [Paludibacteraceae bacterium]
MVFVFAADACGQTHMPSGSLMLIAIATSGMLLLSAVCVCVLVSIYDDWKWRNIKKHEKWKRRF